MCADRSRKRFQILIAQEKGDRSPWDPFPEDKISMVAHRLDASDIADIFSELDILAQERNKTPDWDGDTQDDIAKAEELFCRILASVPEHLLPDVEAGQMRAEGMERANLSAYLSLALRARRS
jgi:hypothetical protein